jgi:hypothetical protein
MMISNLNPARFEHSCIEDKPSNSRCALKTASKHLLLKFAKTTPFLQLLAHTLEIDCGCKTQESTANIREVAVMLVVNTITESTLTNSELVFLALHHFAVEIC